MDILNRIVLTEIKKPITVFSKKGRIDITNKRSCYALSLCIDGQITYMMNDSKYVSNKNSAVLLPKGSSYTLCGDKEGLFPVINFECTGFDCREIMVFPISNQAELISDYETIKRLFAQKENCLKVFSIFYGMLDKISNQQKAKNSVLYPLNDFIEENFHNTELSNVMLAAHLGISEVYLRKLFNTEFGMSPKQYILKLRIKKARQLLTDTKLSVTEISEHCGFSSVYHFCRIFKLKTSVTPTEYAENNKIYRI